MTRKGTSETPRVPAAKLEKSMKAVALVGPILVKREDAKMEPTIAAMAAHMMPLTIGSPAMVA